MGHAYYIVGLAWSPDGTRLVAVGSTASPHGGIEFIDVDPLLLP